MSFYPAFSIQDPVLEDCKVGHGVLLAVTVTASEVATRPCKAKLLEHVENTVTRTMKSITDSYIPIDNRKFQAVLASFIPRFSHTTFANFVIVILDDRSCWKGISRL